MDTAAPVQPPILLALRDIKLAHTVFALPFAVLGAILARDPHTGWKQGVGQLALVVACMFFARTWAMLVNRIADARHDADNPRTERRAVASGALARTTATGYALASGALFIAVCALFWVFYDNPWPTILSLPTLAWIAFYSFTKRFTWLCHVFLGGALASSPLAAAIAVEPAALTSAPALWWIAGMVLCWVAGFDVLYALQDIDFDRGAGLHSVPARFGWRRSLWISRTLHAAAFACLFGTGFSDARLDTDWWIGVGVVGVLLVLEHLVVVRRGLGGLPMAFFTLNGVVSILLGLLGVWDVLAG